MEWGSAMSIATLDRARPATVTHDAFEALVAGLAPVSFPSVDDVQSMAGRLLPVIGCRTGAGFIGQTYYQRSRPAQSHYALGG